MSDLVGYQGRASDHTFVFRTTSGTAIDISSYKLKFSVVADREATSSLFELSNTAGGGGDTEIEFTTDGTDGSFIVHVGASDTTSLEMKTYVWEIIYQIGSNDPKKMGEGRFVVKESWATAFS